MSSTVRCMALGSWVQGVLGLWFRVLGVYVLWLWGFGFRVLWVFELCLTRECFQPATNNYSYSLPSNLAVLGPSSILPESQETRMKSATSCMKASNK